MPIYTFKCDKCGHEEDMLVKMNDTEQKNCPKCGELSFGKILSTPNFHLKGSGWYQSDFKNKGGGGCGSGGCSCC